MKQPGLSDECSPDTTLVLNQRHHALVPSPASTVTLSSSLLPKPPPSTSMQRSTPRHGRPFLDTSSGPNIPTMQEVRKLITVAMSNRNARIYSAIDSAANAQPLEGMTSNLYLSRAELVEENSVLKKRVADDVLLRYEKKKWAKELSSWETSRDQLEQALSLNSTQLARIAELEKTLHKEQMAHSSTQQALNLERTLRTNLQDTKKKLQNEVYELERKVHWLEEDLFKHENTTYSRLLRTMSDFTMERNLTSLTTREQWLRDKVMLERRMDLAEVGREFWKIHTEISYRDKIQGLNDDIATERKRIIELNQQLGVASHQCFITETYAQHALETVRCDLLAKRDAITDELTRFQNELHHGMFDVEKTEFPERLTVQNDECSARYLMMVQLLCVLNSVGVSGPQALLGEVFKQLNEVTEQLQPMKDHIETDMKEKHERQLKIAAAEKEMAQSRAKLSASGDIDPTFKKTARFPRELPEPDLRRMYRIFRAIDVSDTGQISQNDCRAFTLTYTPAGRILDSNAFKRIDKDRKGTVTFWELLREWFPSIPPRQIEALWDESELRLLRRSVGKTNKAK